MKNDPNFRQIIRKCTQIPAQMGSNICVYLCFSICVHLWMFFISVVQSLPRRVFLLFFIKEHIGFLNFNEILIR